MRFVVLFAIVTLATRANAHTPPTADAFSRGLDLKGDTAPALGVVLLRSAPEGRVWLPGSTFTMGASERELFYAFKLCDDEPLGQLTSPRGTHYCDNEDFRIETPRHLVALTGFAIDRTEVRVEDYDRCVIAGACSPAGFRRGDHRYDQPNFPVTSVEWSAADNYCKWMHGSLPTEAQWEFAARGTEGRTFPWGNIYNAHLANHGSLGEDSTDGTDGYVGLAPVGSFPDGATRSGIFDLAGNVEEWVIDRIDIDVVPATGNAIIRPYSLAPAVNPVATAGIGHFARGGSYRGGAHTLRTTARTPLVTITSGDFIGFRCVYDAL